MATVTVTDACPMGTLEFIASVVHSIAWPLALVVAILVFRRPLAERIRAIAKVSHGDTQVEFDQAARDVKASLAFTQVEPASSRFVAEMAAQLPERIGRIVRAWADIENWLREKVPAEGVDPSALSAPALIEAALRRGVVTVDQAQTLRGLLAMRNLAVHGRTADIDEGRANEFLMLALAMKLILNIPSE